MPPRVPISEIRRGTAQRLRANTTDAEDKLWRRLKSFPIDGTHFRRQVPIGPYVADFACLTARLVIEIDGSQHDRDGERARDEQRTRWLEAEGYRVLRFWNNDVTGNIPGVLEAIHHELTARGFNGKITPPRRAARVDPPPQGEGEER